MAELETDLRRAATYRFLGLLFAPPTDAIGQELAELGPLLGEELREDAVAAAAGTSGALQGLYHRIVGPSGQVADLECAYDDNTVGGRGQVLADIAGYHRAFRYEPSTRAPVSPDHIGTELDFLGWMALKRAYAGHAGLGDEIAIVDAARERFVTDHLGRWAVAFLDELGRRAEGTHYEAVAALALRALLVLEGERLRPPSGRRKLPLVDDEDELRCAES